MALVHRPGHVGQGSAVFKGVLFPIPAFEQIEPNLARIEVEGVNLIVGEITESFTAGGGQAQLCGRWCLGQRWRDRHKEGQPRQGYADREPALALPLGP